MNKLNQSAASARLVGRAEGGAAQLVLNERAQLVSHPWAGTGGTEGEPGGGQGDGGLGERGYIE